MAKKQLIIPIFIPFGGCPNQCVFCDQKTITGKMTPPEKEGIKKTVESHLSTWSGTGRKEIAFYGGSFTGLPKTLQEQYLKTAYGFVMTGTIDSIRISTRPDYVTRDSLGLLKRYRVETVELGVQSMDDEVLKLSGRGHTASDTIEAVKILRGEGFKIGIQIMPGLPGDTRESIIETAKKVEELNPDLVRIYPVLVIKNTPLYRMFINGEYTPWTLDDMVDVLKKVYAIFSDADIFIARVGLNPSKELKENIVSGPWHPRLREMVVEDYP